MKHARLPRLSFPAGLDPTARLQPGASVEFPLGPGELLHGAATFNCGQIFRWRECGGIWYGPTGRSALAVTSGTEGIRVALGGESLALEAIWRFLGLDWPLAEVARRLARDRWLQQATVMFPGLRVLRQDPWSCVLAFLCAQWSSIAKIESSLDRIARRAGETVSLAIGEEEVEIALLPGPEALADLTELDLRECGLGYRARYVLGSARAVASGEVELGATRGRPYAEALVEITRLPGVGRKVADCILLFCLDQPRACPVDVWVRRAFRECYPRALRRYLPDLAERGKGELSAVEHRALIQFAWDRWGELSGYAQQYLFHARRHGLGRVVASD